MIMAVAINEIPHFFSNYFYQYKTFGDPVLFMYLLQQIQFITSTLVKLKVLRFLNGPSVSWPVFATVKSRSMSYLNHTSCSLQPAVLIKYNSTTCISCECFGNFQNSFVTEHFCMAGTKLFNTWMHLNIHNTFCWHVRMCIYIKGWLGGKWDWNCYLHTLVYEVWMRPIIGQLAAGEWNCKELKRMADWEGEQNLRVIIWDKSAIVCVEIFSRHCFSSRNGSGNYYVRETLCWDELLLPSFTLGGNDAVAITTVSAKFHGLTLMAFYSYFNFLRYLRKYCCVSSK